MESVGANDSGRSSAAFPAEAAAPPPLMIFINYRHEDMPFAATILYRELQGPFGKENIFFDEGTLRPGMRFLEEIKSHLAGPPGAFLALIGTKWLPTMISHRQQGDEDYVAKEIELALSNGWTVIPVLLNEASLPERDRLPPAVKALLDNQAARLRQTSLEDDIKNLSARLKEIRNTEDKPPAGIEPVIDVRDEKGPEPPPPVDDDHYRMLVEEGDNLVIFLGAGVNADDRDGPFREGAAMLPDDTDLAKYLADKVRLTSRQRDLAEVAQYVRMIRGEPRVFGWVKEAFQAESEPGPVHKYLARLPRRLEELGLRKRYQMIVTPKFDAALEHAFREEREPFDVAVYMAGGTEYAGRFVHLSWWHEDPQPVLTPNDYDGFPFVTDDGELERTLIVRIHGGVDDLSAGYRWKSNLVITEDHYIDYLRGRSPEAVVPGQILAKLQNASCLFLGYRIADWRLRVFLHWIWRGEMPIGATHWAVERDPDPLEQEFWRRSGVHLYTSRLSDYVKGFDRFLVNHLNELI
jgi:SIR2-like domain/TIR domain